MIEFSVLVLPYVTAPEFYNLTLDLRKETAYVAIWRTVTVLVTLLEYGEEKLECVLTRSKV